MTIKLVQDSIIFISGLKKTELEEANRFVPEACTLVTRDETTKKATPICAIAFAAEGSITSNGIVYDSVTEEGYMCKTLVATSTDEALTSEEKVKAVSEEFATLILRVNDLEAQIKSALASNCEKIEAAKQAIEVVSL